MLISEDIISVQPAEGGPVRFCEICLLAAIEPLPEFEGGGEGIGGFMGLGCPGNIFS
jgi:hypothetical protein